MQQLELQATFRSQCGEDGMAPRSISDEEIALIKAMKMRGMKGKDIQFYFNRPDRAVNSGRISGICDGKYGNSASIPPAPDEMLDAFLAGTSPSNTLPATSPSSNPDPISEATLRALFAESDGLWRLKAGESDEHECKEGFGFANSGKWLRAIAALANNRGGYVLFGVHDKDKVKEDGVDLSHAVVGLKGREFEEADTVRFTSVIKSTFDPTPRIRKAVVEMAGKRVGVLHVEAHPSRPVIATKQGQDIREGDIFFRYAAQSSLIKYSDLRALLDARDAETRRQLLPMVEKLIALGPQNTLIANLEDGALEDGRRAIKLDKDVVANLKFIKEGEFDERMGAPAVKLLGTFDALVAAGEVQTAVVTRADIIPAFLEQQRVADPDQFIRLLVEATQDQWMPLFFFAAQAGMSTSDLRDFCLGLSARKSRRNWFCSRVDGREPAYHRAAGAAVAPLAAIKAGHLPEVSDQYSVMAAANAVRGLEERPEAPLPKLLQLLTDCLNVANNTYDPAPLKSSIRRAICRLDELYFREGALAAPEA